MGVKKELITQKTPKEVTLFLRGVMKEFDVLFGSKITRLEDFVAEQSLSFPLAEEPVTTIASYGRRDHEDSILNLHYNGEKQIPYFMIEFFRQSSAGKGVHCYSVSAFVEDRSITQTYPIKMGAFVFEERTLKEIEPFFAEFVSQRISQAMKYPKLF